MNFSTKKYTVRETKKAKCFRCGKSPCLSQVKVNMVSEFYLPICSECDYELRKFMLFFLNIKDMDNILSCFEEQIDVRKWDKMKVEEIGKLLSNFVEANKSNEDVLKGFLSKLESTIDSIYKYV